MERKREKYKYRKAYIDSERKNGRLMSTGTHLERETRARIDKKK